MDSLWLLPKDVQRLILGNLTVDEQISICGNKQDGVCSDNDDIWTQRIEREYKLDNIEQLEIMTKDSEAIKNRIYFPKLGERPFYKITRRDLWNYLGYLVIKDSEKLKEYKIWDKYMKNRYWHDKFIRGARESQIVTDERFLTKYIDTQDLYGRTLLMVSLNNKNEEIVKILINRGANVNISDYYHGDTPLFFAMMYDSSGEYKLLRLLLENGADINRGNNNGVTPLLSIVRQKDIQLAKLLLEYGANVNSQRKDNGDTALIIAVKNGHKEMVELLLANGADDSIANNDGRKAYIIASQNLDFDIARLLRK